MTITASDITEFRPTAVDGILFSKAVGPQTSFQSVDSRITNLVFIDSGVESPEILLNGLSEGYQAFALSSVRGGVEQITDILSAFSGIKSLHILAHGAPGSVSLGAMQLTADNAHAYQHYFQGWKKSLSKDAQLILHSCRVAEGDRGRAFVTKLHETLAIDVSASTTLVGAVDQGGTWQIDYLTSGSQHPMPFSQEAVKSYPHTLAINVNLQAEAARLSGVAVDTLRRGAQGGKYVDYQNSSNDFIEWKVNAPTAGKYTLSWRYANGDSNRPLSLALNGKTVDNSVDFKGTGGWESWKNSKKTVTLKSGTNTIRLKANGSSGANFDYLKVTKSTTTAPSNPTPNPGNNNLGVGQINANLQAESARLSGVAVDTLRRGAQGGKYVDYQNSSNDFIEWKVNAPTAGKYTLSWRYANGDSNRPLSLALNGKTVDNSVDFKGTGGWESWKNSKKTVTLKSGTNTIRLKANGSSGANFDYLKVTKSTTTAPSNPTPNPGNNNPGVGQINANLQAESARLSGAAVDTLRRGAQGGKYVDYQNSSNDFIEWKVNAPTAGKYTLSWRYANGDSNRPLSLALNGKTVDNSVDFKGTGGWESWKNSKKTVTLKSGTNTIRLKANGSSGANFDSLKVTKGATAPSPTPSSKLRVLPLGDSNTRGEGTLGGYRNQFWKRTVADGVAIDFVGTRSHGPSSLGDRDHQGQGGWAIPQMTSWVKAGNLARLNPDIIMFMMGTNDANTDGRVSGREIRNRLSTLIDEVAKAAPRTTLFISSIPPIDRPRGSAAEARSVRDFNALIPSLVSEKASQGKRVSYVNAGGSLNVGDINGDNSRTNDQNDGLHATASGYDKLGNAWYNGVRNSSVWKNATRNAGFIEADQVSDPLTGNRNNNVLASGTGFDVLTGGGGQDKFVYDRPSDGLDRITDFSSNDLLRLSASGFGGDLVAGRSLSSADYVLGSNPAARDSGSTFLFNTGTQTLSVDVDGTGARAAVGLAKFSNGFRPQASQIEIFA